MAEPDWPSDDREWPDDEQLPWAHEVLRQNLIDPEYDPSESAEEYRTRLTAEAEDRDWRLMSADLDGGVFAAVLQRESVPPVGLTVTGYGATIDDALVIALAKALAHPDVQ